ncbi:MAG: cytochrome-c peroxidase [Flavobacteriales bacterium]
MTRQRRSLLLIALLALASVMGCHRDSSDVTPPSSGPGPFPAPTPYRLVIPSNLPPMSIPASNPLTVEGIRLGRFLFYEERLSGDNGMSCASCHAPALSFTDGKAVSKGIDSIAGTRSTMPLINLGYSNFFFWDGRAATLEDQILEPVPNPIEMHETWRNAVSKLQADAAYPALFGAAFGSTHIDSLKVAKAIAQFIRTMVSANSPFDRFRRFEGTIPVAAQQGYSLFQLEGGAVGHLIPVAGSAPVVGQGGADCFHCHTDAASLFTDEQFHNNGLDAVPAESRPRWRNERSLRRGQVQDADAAQHHAHRTLHARRPLRHDRRGARSLQRRRARIAHRGPFHEVHGSRGHAGPHAAEAGTDQGVLEQPYGPGVRERSGLPGPWSAGAVIRRP